MMETTLAQQKQQMFQWSAAPLIGQLVARVLHLPATVRTHHQHPHQAFAALPLAKRVSVGQHQQTFPLAAAP
jgi:hypothetical protein